MRRQSTYLALLVMVLALVLGNPTYGDFSADTDPSLVALWRLDDGTGTTAVDSSPNGNDGTLQGDTQWVVGTIEGAIELDGDGDYVDCGNDAVFDVTEQLTLAIWVNANDMANSEHNCWMGKGDNAWAIKHQSGDYLEFFVYDGDWHSAEYSTDLASLNGEWHHMTGTFDGAELLFYLDGEVAATLALSSTISTSTSNVTLGENSQESGRYFDGILDDARIYSRALTQAEIMIVMLGGASPQLASDPIPGNETTDVPRDGALSWTPGIFAATHDVYFGTVIEDVNGASRTDPRGVLVSEEQSAETYDLGLLDFGQTYYWRIDEVNSAPDDAIFKGEIWSFTAEPLAYLIEGIIATSNATSDDGMGPEKAVDGSGLNADDQHSTDAADMWLTNTMTEPVSLVCEFDRVYKLHEMQVWNYNVLFELALGFGFKDVTIEYSVDGAEWTVLEDVVFAQATARANYVANTTVAFGGIAAQYVRLTASNTYGPIGQYGLSEVRFLYIPAHAREPQPNEGDTGVEVGATLSWRAGREAVSHEVNLGTDPNALVLVDTVTEASYTPGDLEFGLPYFWKIDEVNQADEITVWEGDIWSFSTQEYAAIDDMESYTDDEGNAIYEFWIDGYQIPENGSQVGYIEAPFAERTIINSGAQSMPLHYDNTGTANISEAQLDLGGMDLDTNGADSLRLFVYGMAPAFLENADGSILTNGIGEDIWGTADEFRFVYQQLTGNGSIIARVDDLDESADPWVKAGVMIRQDTQAGAINAFIAITGGEGGGATFQQRPEADLDSVSQNTFDGGPFAPPYWVRIDRVGNAFSAFISPDGQSWTQTAETETLEMDDAVLIGLAVTSHNTDQATSALFSNVSFTGGVSGAWQVAGIGATQPAGNDPQPIYVSLGGSVITHPADPPITAWSGWTEWVIPFSEFGGNLNSVQSMTIGIGHPNDGTSGAGLVFIDDIGFGRPAAPVEDAAGN